MAVRRPLYLDNGNLKEMTDAQIEKEALMAIYLNAPAPAVTLTRTADGVAGNLSTMSDERLKAGAHRTSSVAYPSESVTPEPSTVTNDWDRIQQTVSSSYSTALSDTNNRRFPIYQDNGNIRAMSWADYLDTFIKPAIDLFVDGTDRPGSYRIHTSTSLSGHGIVGSNPWLVFRDTRADTSLYQATSIPEALDQPQTIQNYYLFRTNQGSAPSDRKTCLYITSSGHLQEYNSTTYNDDLVHAFRWGHTGGLTGYAVTYGIGGTGNQRGSAMTDTKLNGSGNRQTRFVNANDYRAQEFPNGSAVTRTTYTLKIKKG